MGKKKTEAKSNEEMTNGYPKAKKQEFVSFLQLYFHPRKGHNL